MRKQFDGLLSDETHRFSADVGEGIVLVEDEVVGPHVWSLPPQMVQELAQDFNVVGRVDGLAIWDIVVVQHPFRVKECHQHNFLCTLSDLGLPGWV